MLGEKMWESFGFRLWNTEPEISTLKLFHLWMSFFHFLFRLEIIVSSKYGPVKISIPKWINQENLIPYNFMRRIVNPLLARNEKSTSDACVSLSRGGLFDLKVTLKFFECAFDIKETAVR